MVMDLLYNYGHGSNIWYGYRIQGVSGIGYTVHGNVMVHHGIKTVADPPVGLSTCSLFTRESWKVERRR